MTYLKPNSFRAMLGLVALASMVFGALILWGVGGAMLVGGLFLAIDASCDEAMERITKTTRFRLPDAKSPKENADG